MLIITFFHFHTENIPISKNDSSNIVLRTCVAANGLYCDWHHRFFGVRDFDRSITDIYWLHIIIGSAHHWYITGKSLLDVAMVNHQYIPGYLDQSPVHAKSIWFSVLYAAS